MQVNTSVQPNEHGLQLQSFAAAQPTVAMMTHQFPLMTGHPQPQLAPVPMHLSQVEPHVSQIGPTHAQLLGLKHEKMMYAQEEPAVMLEAYTTHGVHLMPHQHQLPMCHIQQQQQQQQPQHLKPLNISSHLAGNASSTGVLILSPSSVNNTSNTSSNPNLQRPQAPPQLQPFVFTATQQTANPSPMSSSPFSSSSPSNSSCSPLHRITSTNGTTILTNIYL